MNPAPPCNCSRIHSRDCFAGMNDCKTRLARTPCARRLANRESKARDAAARFRQQDWAAPSQVASRKIAAKMAALHGSRVVVILGERREESRQCVDIRLA